MKYDLIGVGNALVDIEVCVDDSFIKKNSLTKGGMALFDKEGQENILKELHGHTFKISSGGSAANTIHGVSILGGQTYYLGRVANDLYGRHYSEDMKSCGVGFPGPGIESNTTGTCVILVSPDGERTMLTHLGISSSLEPRNIDEKIIRNAGMVYIEGYLWTGEETRRAALKLAAIAKQNNLPVAFTLSDAFVANSFKKQITDFIRSNVDILFCNDIEAMAMAETKNIQEAFETLKDIAHTLYITRGGDGSWVSNSTEKKIELSVFPTKAVDTTGAGDLYAAGALYGLIKKYSIKESAIIGSYCASKVVSHMGARLPINLQADSKKIIESYQWL